MSTASPSPHADLDRFVDGELPPEEAERFREHLGGCGACQARLHERVQLAGLAQGALGGEAAPAPSAQVIRPARWRVRAAAGVGVALAASLAVVISGRLGGAPPPSLWLADGPQRPLEARLSSPAADHWRPYEMTRGAEPAPPPPLPELAKLERRGELVAIADAYLSRGAPEAARPYLDRAGNGADALATRAAMDLMLGQPNDALHHSAQALALRPGSGVAGWNRALALRALGLSLSAAKELDGLAQVGEPGWSDEARRLALRLREEVERRDALWTSAKEACQRAVDGAGPFPADAAGVPPSFLRRCFDDVLSRTPTAEAVRALLPAAETLDRRLGGDAVRRQVQRVLGQPFQGREALARRYATLEVEKDGASERIDLADRAQKAGQRDLELQALLQILPDRALLERLQALALATADPWYASRAEDRFASGSRFKHRQQAGRELLSSRVKACTSSDRYELGCLAAERIMTTLFDLPRERSEALDMGMRALERARRESDLAAEVYLLQVLADVENKQIDSAGDEGDPDLAAAYLQERLLRRTVTP